VNPTLRTGHLRRLRLFHLLDDGVEERARRFVDVAGTFHRSKIFANLAFECLLFFRYHASPVCYFRLVRFVRCWKCGSLRLSHCPSFLPSKLGGLASPRIKAAMAASETPGIIDGLRLIGN